MAEQKQKEQTNAGLSLEEMTDICADEALNKKAYDLVVLDLREHSSVTDLFMICSGHSTRQVQAMAEAIDERLGRRGVNAMGIEGQVEARWVLMDYVDLVVHIFHHETRKVYDLERLWGNAPIIINHRGEQSDD
jgi:ribosome-associated protein